MIRKTEYGERKTLEDWIIGGQEKNDDKKINVESTIDLGEEIARENITEKQREKDSNEAYEAYSLYFSYLIFLYIGNQNKNEYI